MSSAIVSATIGVVLLAAAIGYFYPGDLPEPPPKIVGIDLGTTFSSIGFWHPKTGKTEVIADSKGRRSIPSVVAFLPDGRHLVGFDAVAQSEKNAAGTIYDAKRFIGLRFELGSERLNQEIRRYPFKIHLMDDGSVRFVVPTNAGQKLYSPEDIGALIIKHLRSFCETPVDKAVLTVPAEFDEERRNASQNALERAGMEVYRVISEPTAAALSYGIHLKTRVNCVMVVDLGGGTLDVSILMVQNQMFITVAMAGNNRLGGQDFNQRLLIYLLQQIKSSHGQLIDDAEDLQTLRLAVEQAKIELTTRTATQVQLTLRQIGKYSVKISRDKFEELNADLFESILDPVQAALDDAEMGREEIDEIVLVGGSTRVPAVRRTIGQYFGRAPNHGTDPELAVVTGAAVQAGVIGNSWPLQVAAIELAQSRRKVHVYSNHSHPSAGADDMS